MAATQAVKPVITPLDRLGLTLSLAILVHAMLILGITFIQDDRAEARYETMEIVLVRQKSPEPQEADVLAQANLEGGGGVEDPVNPRASLPDPGLIAPPLEAAPRPSESAPEITMQTETAPPKADPMQEIVVEDDSGPAPLTEKVERPAEKIEPAPAGEKTREAKTDRKTPSATELLASSFKIAALSADIRQKLEVKAKRPKRKFISANTKEYRYAAYMEAWRAKVERVGNLNYPEEARRRKLSGSLLLEVALNADGTINEMTIRRSSGQKILDDAAIRIVELAAPFAPFPQHVKQETDILHIIRTWQFINNQGFR